MGTGIFASVTKSLLWEDNLHQKTNSVNQQCLLSNQRCDWECVDIPVGPLVQVAPISMADRVSADRLTSVLNCTVEYNYFLFCSNMCRNCLS